MTAAIKNIAKALEPYTSCDISDALSKLKFPPHGGFLPGLTMFSPARQSGPTKICGPAYTVLYARHDDPQYLNNNKTSTSPSLPAGHYIDAVPPGAVVFISAPKKMVNACYGGLMSTRAQFLGAAGAIVDGRVRDLQEHRDLQFPVFAADVGTTAPAEEARVVAVNGRVKLNDESVEAWVNAGDWLVADLNGVVCVPQGVVEEVVGLMASQVEADERVKEDILRGEKVGDAMKRHRKNVKQPGLER